MKNKFLIVVFMMLSYSLGYADVVFLDLNFNPKEVESAKRAAENRGENFYTYPVYEESDLQRIKFLIKRSKYFHRMWLKAYDKNPNAQWREPQESKSVKQELESFKYKYMVDYHSVSDFLKNNINQGELSSMVISGHSEGSSYFGAMGGISFKEIEDILSRQNLKNNLESVYLWGCFTGTPGAMLMWRESFPSLNAVAGFEGRSPLGDMKNSYELLEKLMTREGEISTKARLENLSRAVRSINYEYLTGLTYVQGDCYVSGLRKKEARYIWETPNDCKGRVTVLLTQQETHYIPYMNGEKLLPNPDSGTTKLRKFYDVLQSSYHCLDHCKTNNERNILGDAFADDQDAHNYDEKKLPCPEEVIRLIKFEHISNNFNVFHKDALNLLDKIGKENQIVECSNLFNSKGASALKDFNKDLQTTQNCFRKILEVGFDLNNLNPLSIERIQSMAKHAHGISNNLSDCTPFSWIEDQITPEEPGACI